MPAPNGMLADGCPVAVRDGEPRVNSVRLYAVEDGWRVLRALDPDRAVDADNETDIRGVVAFPPTKK